MFTTEKNRGGKSQENFTGQFNIYKVCSIIYYSFKNCKIKINFINFYRMNNINFFHLQIFKVQTVTVFLILFILFLFFVIIFKKIYIHNEIDTFIYFIYGKIKILILILHSTSFLHTINNL